MTEGRLLAQSLAHSVFSVWEKLVLLSTVLLLLLDREHREQITWDFLHQILSCLLATPSFVPLIHRMKLHLLIHSWFH